MKVIILTGLVSEEKAQLSRDLARYFADDKHVAVIDNIARMSLDTIDDKIVLKRVDGEAPSKLLHLLHEIRADVTIIAVSEQTHPEKLFVALDDLHEHEPEWEIFSLALIDTRTCDCFPNVREALELFADISVMMPYQLDEILDYVDSA